MSVLDQVTLLSDQTANDSDKIFTVPIGSQYRILHGLVEYSTDPTVGNRQFEVHIRDENDVVVYRMEAGLVLAENITHRYILSPGLGIRDTSAISETVLMPLPVDLRLNSGWDIRVFDSAAIAAATDDMFVSITVEEII